MRGALMNIAPTLEITHSRRGLPKAEKNNNQLKQSTAETFIHVDSRYSVV